MSAPHPELALRPATAADQAFLGAVYADTRQEELAPVPWTTGQKDAFLAAQFAAQSTHYAQHYVDATHNVVLVDGQPAGRLIILRTPREIRIVDIALLRAYRARGVGTRLLQPILDEADAGGLLVSIHVEHLNPAMRLYRRLGFVSAGDAGVHVLMERRPQRGDDGVTRRRLLQTGAVAGAALALGGTRGAAPARAQDVPAYLRRSSYSALVGTSFAAPTPTAAAVSLTLVEVADLVRARQDATLRGSDQAFALVLNGPRDPVLEQGTRELRHPALGAFEVFVVPVERSSGSQHYELVVDRSVGTTAAARVAPEPLALSNATTAAADAPPTAGFPARRRHPGCVVRAAVARRGGVLAADLTLDRSRRPTAVRVTLVRGDVRYASATRRLRGRRALRLPLREFRRVPSGAYELVVTTSDRTGRRATVRRRVWLTS